MSKNRLIHAMTYSQATLVLLYSHLYQEVKLLIRRWASALNLSPHNRPYENAKEIAIRHYIAEAGHGSYQPEHGQGTGIADKRRNIDVLKYVSWLRIKCSYRHHMTMVLFFASCTRTSEKEQPLKKILL